MAKNKIYKLGERVWIEWGSIRHPGTVITCHSDDFYTVRFDRPVEWFDDEPATEIGCSSGLMEPMHELKPDPTFESLWDLDAK